MTEASCVVEGCGEPEEIKDWMLCHDHQEKYVDWLHGVDSDTCNTGGLEAWLNERNN